MKAVILALLLLAASAQDLQMLGDVEASVQKSQQTNGSDIIPPVCHSSSFKFRLLHSTSQELVQQKTSQDSRILQTCQVPPSQPKSWNFLDEPNGLKWMTPNGDRRIFPLYWMSTYLIKFTTDCLKNSVTLFIASTGSFKLSLNGQPVQGWTNPSQGYQTVILQPSCQCNTIEVTVYNYYYESPAALSYKLSQSTANCYNCTNQGLTYYDRSTCSCKCTSVNKCSSSLMQWYEYPLCGCKCSSLVSWGSCSSLQVWNASSCQCECKKKCCASNQFQNPANCQCECRDPGTCVWPQSWNSSACRCQCSSALVRQCKIPQVWNDSVCNCICPYFKQCKSPQVWSNDSCSCICPKITSCTSPQIWSNDNCSCICPKITSCRIPYIWTNKTCSCECPKVSFCPYPKKWNNQTCSCQCGPIKPCTVGRTFNYNTCSCQSIIGDGCAPGWIYDIIRQLCIISKLPLPSPPPPSYENGGVVYLKSSDKADSSSSASSDSSSQVIVDSSSQVSLDSSSSSTSG